MRTFVDRGTLDKMLIQICALLLLTQAAIVQSLCINSWAVEVHGGREVAEKVARKYGFELREEVGNGMAT